MVDYEYFKAFLSEHDPAMIENGDMLDNKVIMLFARSKPDKVKSLFKCSNMTIPFKVEIKCSKCGGLEWQYMSKTKLIHTIQDLHMKREVVCNRCIAKKELEEAEERRRVNAQWEQMVKENTKIYIQRYLDPDNSWKKGIKTWEKINDLKAHVEWDEVESHIKGMTYREFLMTPYWKAIAEDVKRKSGNKCQLCNSTEGLNVHHRTYENHGDELHNMKDLICLCADCHSKFHGHENG